MTYVVTAPYVTLKVRSEVGVVLREFYVGSPVPAAADADNVARLLRKGMLGEVAEPALPEPAAEPVGDGRPKDYAPKGEWVDFAVSKRAEGVSADDARAEAEGKTKDALIAEHGN